MSLSIGVSAFGQQHFAASVTTGAVTPQTSGSTFALFITGGAVSSLTDSQSNTYTLRQTFTINGGTRTAWMYDCQNAVGAASMTFTYTPTGTGTCVILMAEIATGAGSGIYPVLDGTVQLTSSTNTLVGPSATAAGSNEVGISCIFGAGAGTTVVFSDSTGWNNLLQSITDAVNYYVGAISATTISSAGSYNDTYSGSTNVGTSNGLVTALYKASGGIAPSAPTIGQAWIG